MREYPKIDTPVVSVRTVYNGASPQVIESQVTQPLEDQLSGIEGVRTIKSVVARGSEQITVEFVPERDADAAANDVRDRVARVRGRCRDEVDEPIVAKIEADAQAIIWLAFSIERHGALDITDYADRYVADRLKTLPGVASRHHRRRAPLRDAHLARPRPARRLRADAAGRGERAAPAEHRSALRAHRKHAAASSRCSRETDLRTPEQFNNLIISRSRTRLSGAPAATSAAPSWRPQDERNIVRVNGNAGGGPGHRQAVHRQHAGGGAGGEGAGAEHSGGAARGHEAAGRLRHLGVHRRIDQGGVPRPWSRRCCWWCW